MEESIYNERREMLKELFNDGKIKPMRFKELCGFLNVPKDERNDFHMILESLISDGLIVCDASGLYGLSKARTMEGTYSASARGFGFVIVSDGGEDIFIPERKTLGAVNGDKVAVKVVSEGHGKHSREGEIVSIIRRGNERIVGTVDKSGKYVFVIPDNRKLNFEILVPEEFSMNAVSGMKVVCNLIYDNTVTGNPEGKITEILGHVDDPGIDVLSVIRELDIPETFPEEVLTEVRTEVPAAVDPAEYEGRTDIRNLMTVTIDGEDAKDLDDAITLTYDGVYHLGVHIADVSNYVKEHSPLDEEAYNRGTSVYVADRVIPMLPHELSNGICSLNEGVDRLALSCFMDYDDNGKILSHSIEETVINVDRRMSYTDVYACITESNTETMKKYEQFLDFFNLMHKFSKILRENRFKRGSIDFDLPECVINIDEEGRVTEVLPYKRNDAHKIIEEFMLAANETVAEEFYWAQIPFVYRVHEEPDEEKIDTLREFVKGYGYDLRVKEEIHGTTLQKLLDAVEGSEEEVIIRNLTLRSMKQARYSTDNIGHFGLASRYYCHFTSPIRRYPDLQIHRIIKEYLHGLSEKRLKHYENILPEVASRCSITERRAETAERETDKMKKAEYMAGFIGEGFTGVVSGITHFGIFVMLPDTCEGLIRFTDCDDRFTVDENCYNAVSEKTHRVYRLGQSVDIRVAAADKMARTVDFVFAEERNG